MAVPAGPVLRAPCSLLAHTIRAGRVHETPCPTLQSGMEPALQHLLTTPCCKGLGCMLPCCPAQSIVDTHTKHNAPVGCRHVLSGPTRSRLSATNLCLHKHHRGPPVFLGCDVAGVRSSTCSPQGGLLMQTALPVTLQQPAPPVSHASAGGVCTSKYAASVTHVKLTVMIKYTCASASNSYQALCRARA